MSELQLLLVGAAGLALAGAAAATTVVISRRRAAEREATLRSRSRRLEEDPIIAAMGLDSARSRDRGRGDF